MKFSTRTTYGLRAMIRLAKSWGQDCVSLARIAKEEKISQRYLERLFAKLKKTGLVKAKKGASGGYCLTKDPRKIIVYDIIKVLEGRMSPFYCLSEDGKIFCEEKYRCGATKVLIKVQKAVNSTLKGITLDELG